MATASTRRIAITFTVDVTFTQTFAAAANASSPGENDLVTLASGANTITVPTSGTVPTAVTIIPPAGNVVTMIFKGVTGDTGVGMHLTDPSTFALAATVTTFCITAGATLTGLRLVWT